MDPNEKRLKAYQKGKKKSSEDERSRPRDSSSPSSAPRTPGGGTPRGDPEQGARSNQPELAGFEKTVSQQGLDKAARLLVALGADQASEVLKHLPEAQVEALMARVAATKTVRRSEIDQLLHNTTESAGSKEISAGPDVAEKMLEAAFGSERAGAFMKVVRERRGEKRFAFLGELEAPQVVTLLRGESEAVMSVVFSNMPSEKAAAVLSKLPEEEKQRVGVRMARMSEVGTETLDRIEEGLRSRIETQGRVISEEVDGREALARILRFMNVRDEDAILQELADSDPQLSADVRDRLFTIDTLEYIDDKDLSRVLREFDDKSIALFLKGKEERIRSRILHNVSERRRQIISEEYAHLGPVRKSEADEAATEFLRYLQRLEEEGTLVVRRPDEEYL